MNEFAANVDRKKDQKLIEFVAEDKRKDVQKLIKIAATHQLYKCVKVSMILQ